VLTESATHLQVMLNAPFLEVWLFAHALKLDVNGSAEGCSEVGGACCDVAEMWVNGELEFARHDVHNGYESLVYLTDISALLHGDDADLVLFVDPD
jgi:hypothetical protein